MEAVELVILTAVPVPILMGSEGFGAAKRGGVAGGKDCDASRGSVFVGPRMNNCSSLVGDRDSISSVDALEQSSWINKADTESCRNTIHFSSLLKDDMRHELDDGALSNSLGLVAGSEGKQLHKKVGRVPRSNPGCCKRSRTLHQETSSSMAKDLDVKDASYELGSRTIKFFYAEKSQPVKLIGKRGERRNSKVPLKAKHDASSLKAGLLGFSQAPGGNNVFGTYGLKPDMHDITKLIDDLSLNELLDGSYKCPTFAKEKNKKPANTNEKILESVGKAFSILQHRGPSQVKHSDDIDSAISKKIAQLSATSNLPLASSIDGAEENNLASDLSSSTKEACVNAEVPPGSSDSLLHHPRDLSAKLSLPPRKDLDCSLQGTAKLATSSRHSDPNLIEPMSHQFTLPSFSWSHNYNGHSKSNPDSVKVSARSSCQGRWIRIGNTASFLSSGSKCFTDIGNLVYDRSLIPPGSVKYILPETGSSSSKTVNRLVCEQVSSSAVCPTPSQTPPVAALHSPRALAAAQALHNLAHSCPKQTANGIIKWPKQPSQKAMKSRKSTSTKNPENLLAPKSERMLTPLKKHKVSISEKKDHSGRDNAPRAPDTKKHHTSSSFPKPIIMAPMSSRVLEKASHRQQKLQKILRKDWNRAKR